MYPDEHLNVHVVRYDKSGFVHVPVGGFAFVTSISGHTISMTNIHNTLINNLAAKI